MKPKKKQRRYRVSVSILGLDLAIYRFIYSFESTIQLLEIMRLSAFKSPLFYQSSQPPPFRWPSLKRTSQFQLYLYVLFHFMFLLFVQTGMVGCLDKERPGSWASEPEFLDFQGAQESIPRHQFRQPMQHGAPVRQPYFFPSRFLAPIDCLKIPALVSNLSTFRKKERKASPHLTVEAAFSFSQVKSQSKELVRGPPELVQYFCLQGEFTSAQWRCVT